ncbi:hypothetical protein ABPG75_000661 [Micractinium tetrahymenae]
MALLGGDFEGFVIEMLSKDTYQDTLLALVLSLKDLVIDSLDCARRDAILAGAEQLPMMEAIALRLALNLSDTQYKLLTRAMPTWLPPFSQVEVAEAERCSDLQPLKAADGSVIGVYSGSLVTIMEAACRAALQRGVKQRHVKVKFAFDNFSIVGFKGPAVPLLSQPPLPLPLLPPLPPLLPLPLPAEAEAAAAGIAEEDITAGNLLDDDDIPRTPAVPFNSPLRMIPCALVKAKESRETLQVGQGVHVCKEE